MKKLIPLLLLLCAAGALGQTVTVLSLPANVKLVSVALDTACPGDPVVWVTTKAVPPDDPPTTHTVNEYVRQYDPNSGQMRYMPTHRVVQIIEARMVGAVPPSH